MLLIPFLVGTLIGLLILDDRDEQMLIFYSVMPLGQWGYLMYRLASPVIISVIFFFLLGLYNGIMYLEPFQLILAVVLLTFLEAPLVALFMVNLASNKVEGLAVTKGIGVLLAIPFFITFLQTNWVWLGAILPTFWASKAFMYSGDIDARYVLIFIGGLLSHVLLAQHYKWNERANFFLPLFH